MPNSNGPIEKIQSEIERIDNLEIAANLVLQTLAINAVRTLLAVLIALWVLRSKAPQSSTPRPEQPCPSKGR